MEHKPRIARFNFKHLFFMRLLFIKSPMQDLLFLKIINFASIMIVGFNSSVVEVGNIVVGMVHVRVFTKVAI